MMHKDEVIAAYIKLRDMKTEVTRRHKEELETINEKMGKLENWLQRELISQGVESFKTSAGTAFLKRVDSATVSDWEKTLAFIIDQEDWSLLEGRVNKKAVRDFIDGNGAPPPGVSYTETLVTQVRR